jgi:hypothetical protein
LLFKFLIASGFEGIGGGPEPIGKIRTSVLIKIKRQYD